MALILLDTRGRIQERKSKSIYSTVSDFNTFFQIHFFLQYYINLFALLQFLLSLFSISILGTSKKLAVMLFCKFEVK